MVAMLESFCLMWPDNEIRRALGLKRKHKS